MHPFFLHKLILFNITLLCCLSFRMDIYETNGKAPLLFERRALGKGIKVYMSQTYAFCEAPT